ncbi:MAG: Clp protease N-terminal domain-containing protein, partial [Pseudomonadota bacterium]
MLELVHREDAAAVRESFEKALRQGHQAFTPLHMLKVLMDDDEGLASNLIDRAGGRSAEVRSKIAGELARLPRVEGSGAGQLYLRPELARVFDTAEKAAQKAGDLYVTVERLLLALTVEDSEAKKILQNAGVQPQNLNAAIENLRKGRKADSASAESQYDALKRYARDFTAAARAFGQRHAG